MTEHTDNIVSLERENATRNADLIAVDALRRAGLEDVTGEHLDLIAKQVPAVGELRKLHTHYTTGINAIVDHPDADQDTRLDGYAELHADVSGKFEETTRLLGAQLKDARRKLNEQAFGVPGLGSANGPAGESTQSYRDAIWRLKDADADELTAAADIAETTGDLELLKATALIADQRGDRALVHRYLQRNPSAFDAYALRESLPTDATIGALVGAYQPRALNRNDLQPSPVAKRARKEKERAANARRAAALGSRIR
jgi:hypothetical protein